MPVKKRVTKTNSKAKSATKNVEVPILAANPFIDKLKTHRSPAELKNVQRFFRDEGNTQNKFLGVQMKTIFDTAKEFSALPLKEIENLLDSPYYEVRMGAVSIMDFQARNKKITDVQKEKLFKLYIKKHDRINNWDLVDRSAPHVIGAYLSDKPRDILYKLAKSKNVWERRTAIVSTYYFIKQGEVNDTFHIAELLLKDKHDLIHKAAGSWIREAGKKDKARLMQFLDKHASVMPRTMLRYAIENLAKNEKEKYMRTN